MMQDSALSHAFSTFDAIDGVCEKYNPTGLVSIRKMVAEKRSSPDTSIMVYGVYNAGKSTLINALIGEADRAKVTDKPETDRINKYQWREFAILDTPGIDAPESHEAVTREQLLSVDVVIFVVNPLGVLEEEKTLSTLLDLVERNKKIVLVLNCKNKLEPMDAERLKDELRQRLQITADQRGQQQVLQNIPILEVNAKTALKAKLEGKENLLKNSGLPHLERKLHEFLSSVDQSDIVKGFIAELSRFIDETLGLLDEQSDSASIAQIDAFFADISQREVSLRASLKGLIEAKSAYIEKRTFNIISSNPDDAQGSVADLVQSSNAEVFSELEAELRRLATDASVMFGEMLEDISIRGEVKVPQAALSMASSDEDPMVTSQEKDIDLSLLETGVQQVGAHLKTEHIVSVLEVGKQMLPKLFKGIGPATMAKVGEQIIGKVMPAIGLALQAGQALFFALGDDPEEARIREEFRQREQMEERRNQAIRDMSESVAWEFKTSIIKVVEENIRDNFVNVNGKLKEIRSGFSEAERERSEGRAFLIESQATLKAYA